MKRIALFLLLTISAIFVFLPPAAHGADFTIDDFNAAILVNRDSSFTVKETLTVEFHRPRHGIYREIPCVYIDSLGRKIKTPLEVLSVEDANGSKLKAKIIKKGNVVHIRIGDPDRYVSGLQKYEIFYKVENAILFFDDHDELYWNVTGNYWQAEIKRAQGSVSLAGEKTKELLAACYTGRVGSTEKACTYTTFNNTVEFKAGRGLFPGEGLTIAYGWDKGLVSPPSSFRRFLWFINLEQNWIFILPLSALLIMVNLWYRRGRDPRARESVTVMYRPPQFNNSSLCPAEVGTPADETLDSRDITATIVGLAVRDISKSRRPKRKALFLTQKTITLRSRRMPTTRFRFSRGNSCPACSVHCRAEWFRTSKTAFTHILNH
jgi:hypothetical protein